MKSNTGFARRMFPFLLAGSVAGCAISPPEEQVPAPLEVHGILPALLFYQSLQRMPIAEMTRERTVLASQLNGPANQLRLAMVLGHPRGPQDLNRALMLLDSILKSSDSAAQSLQPLTRVMADNYNERLRIDGQLDKQGVQLKESQRRVEENLRKVEETQRKVFELQEKLNSLADIERTLAPRARATRSTVPVISK